MSLKVNSVFTLFVFILLSIIFVDRVCCQRLAFAQSSYNLDISDDPKNIIIKYCKQYADSASEGIDVIQDLIGAGIVPSSYLWYDMWRWNQQYESRKQSPNKIKLKIIEDLCRFYCYINRPSNNYYCLFDFEMKWKLQ